MIIKEGDLWKRKDREDIICITFVSPGNKYVEFEFVAKPDVHSWTGLHDFFLFYYKVS